jgi:hypothetical protein
MANQTAANTASSFNANAGNNASLQLNSNQQQTANIAANSAANIKLQQLQAQSSQDLAKIQGQYQTLASSNTAAANLLANHTAALNAVLSDPNIPVEGGAKQSIINQLNAQLATNMQIVGKMNGLDYGSLLNLPGGSTTTSGSALSNPPADMKAAVTQINSTSSTQDEALQKAYSYAVANGLSSVQIAQQMGITVQQVQAYLAKIGVSLPADATLNNTVSNNLPKTQ